MMKSRPLQTAILVSLLAALLIMASGLAAQEATSGFALTATWLAGGDKLGNATLTPLPSLTPGAGGAGGAAATRVPATVPAITGPSATPWPSSTPLPSLTPATGGAAATLPPTNVPAVTNPTTTPLPSLTAGPRLTVTSLPSLTPGGQTAATQAVTESAPAATRTLAPSSTPLPSLTPGGQTAATQAATEGVPAATRTIAPSSTPLPSLTPAVGGGVVGGEATPAGGEAVPTESAGVAEATQSDSDLAAIRIVVPSVSLAQEAPPAPETAAGLGTLILLMGLGAATVVGLLMLARDRFRDHSDEPANQE